MDRYTRKRMIILAILAIIAYIGIYHVILPGRVELLKKVCMSQMMGESRPGDTQSESSNTTPPPQAADGQDHYTLSYENKGTKDKAYELMNGGGGE